MRTVIAGYQQLVPVPLIEALRYFADEADAGKTLCDAQLGVIREQGWFKAFMPTDLGGLALDLPAAVRLEESLAYVDGSIGWTVTLCAGAGLFVGVMDPGVLPAVALPMDACFAGSGQPLGVAVARDGGYEISGKWPYATGLLHSTVVTANCRIATSRQQANRDLPIKSFFFYRDQVEVIPDWDTMGLRGTGSHSFRVGRVWVPQEQTFDISPDTASLPHPVYRYPFNPFSEITLAVNTLGMYVHLLEACEELIRRRADAHFALGLIHEAGNRLLGLRQQFYERVDASWTQHCATGGLSEEMEKSVSKVCRQLVRTCQSEAARLYPQAGMDAANPSSPVNRVWRDLFTASQHSILRD